jgi:hypothetical protein
VRRPLYSAISTIHGFLARRCNVALLTRNTFGFGMAARHDDEILLGELAKVRLVNGVI